MWAECDWLWKFMCEMSLDIERMVPNISVLAGHQAAELRLVASLVAQADTARNTSHGLGLRDTTVSGRSGLTCLSVCLSHWVIVFCSLRQCSVLNGCCDMVSCCCHTWRVAIMANCDAGGAGGCCQWPETNGLPLVAGWVAAAMWSVVIYITELWCNIYTTWLESWTTNKHVTELCLSTFLKLRSNLGFSDMILQEYVHICYKLSITSLSKFVKLYAVYWE